MLTELTTGGTEQMSLFSMGEAPRIGRHTGDKRMAVLDKVNARMGPGNTVSSAPKAGTAAIRRRSASSEKWRMAPASSHHPTQRAGAILPG